MTNTFIWNVSSGLFSDASSWLDQTTATPGPPTNADVATFSSDFGSISGTGTASTVNFAATGTIAGSITAQNSANSITQSSGVITIASGGTLSAAGQVRIVNNTGTAAAMVIAAGGTLTDTRDPSLQATQGLYGMIVGGPQGAGAGSSVTVDGSGARLDLGLNAIFVGESASTVGSLTIANGGTVITGSYDGNNGPAVRVGKYGTGSLTLTGAGSSLVATGGVYIGRGSTGSGTLVVSNNATMSVLPALNNGAFVIGSGQPANNLDQVAGTGVVTVTSGGLVKTSPNIVGVAGVVIGGRGDTGILHINAGGTVETGTNLIMGGTTIYLGVNYASTGTLDIAAGGVLKSDGPHTTGAASVTIGAGQGASDVATVSGAGSLLDAGGDRIVVGDGGTGSLTVSQGGSVSAGASFYSDTESALVLGATLGAIGNVTLTDAGSSLNVAGEIDIGGAGYGALAIANGATLSAASAVIGLSTGGYGSVTMSGTGSLLTLTGTLQVGSATADGAGVLTLGSGSKVIASAVQIGNLAVIHMQGGTLDPFSITNTGVVAGYGVLDGPLVNSGTFTATGGSLEVVGDVSGGGNFTIGNLGTVNLDSSVATGTVITFSDNTGSLAIADSNQFAGTISGFHAGNTITFAGASTVTYDNTTHLLTISNNGTQTTVGLMPVDPGTVISTSGNGVAAAPCFASGTRIATTRGLVPVEALRMGDLAVLAHGGNRSIVWLGYRRVDCRRHPRPWDVLPVRVAAGAFAENRPCRDLLLSPDHAVHVNGVLIPIRYLINDATIVQEHTDEVSYWHVELDAHDTILAENLACESYLDTGNRDGFDNAPVTALNATFACRDREVWEQRSCAPLVEGGPLLDTVRTHLAERAGPSLPQAEIVHITAPGVLRAILPAGTGRVHLISPYCHPTGERRRLGAAIGAIAIDGMPIALDATRLDSGFHEVEPGWRWTNGAGVLLLEPSSVARELLVNVAMLAASTVDAA